LMRSPVMHARLMKSIAEVKAGKAQSHDLIDVEADEKGNPS